MNVRLRIQFNPPIDEDWVSLRGLARSLTDDPEGIHVCEDRTPGWLVVEFTMKTEPQYKALPKIESAIRFYAHRRWDTTFSFPMTPAERARADRKAARRKARRQAKRESEG
jgi:hypothetical protein